MASHTPGPWTAVGCTGIFAETDGASVCIATVHPRGIGREKEARICPSDHNRERIVACVNACEGINPEAVPDLLSACVGLVRAWERDEPMHDGNPRTFSDPIGQARLAIAKAREVRS